MAKKSRTPPPPRRVQAPKRREATRPDADARRQRLILYGLASSGLLALGLVVLLLFLLRDGSGSLAATLEDAGCTLETFPDQGRRHVNDLQAEVDYNSFPPTSGPHHGQWAIWDIYDSPVNQRQAVHNLEHGGIVIQYGSDVPESTVDQIGEFYRDDPNGMLVAPLPRLGDKLALTAWTHLATCTAFDEKAFAAFRDAYRYQGPERIPPENLEPGT